VEVVAVGVDGVHLCVGDLDAFGIAVGVEFAAHDQAFVGCGGGDQLDDGLVADEWPPAPVLGGERAQPMLDLVPFAGSGRQMADGDFEIEFVG
jgi:hypothetical protein